MRIFNTSLLKSRDVKSLNITYANCMCACSVFATTWTVALQAPVSLGFSRQEYWDRLPFPISRDLPDPGIKPASLASPALAGYFFTALPGKPHIYKLVSNTPRI